MIKFFRKIRQDLLSEGKTKAYFKYATGEIALVVIGILIALQINNWNTAIKLSNTEKELLQAMKENLYSDIQDMEENLREYEMVSKASMKVLTRLQTGYYDKDSISFYYSYCPRITFFIETTSAYENLKTIGFEIIKNDSLKKNIMYVYGKEYQLIDNIENGHTNFVYSTLHPFFTDNFYAVSEEESYAVNISELEKNHRFKEILKSNYGWTQALIAQYKKTKLKVESTVAQIDAELREKK